MTELLIDGEWVPAEGASAYELFDPTNREFLATIQCASAGQRDAALEAGRGAWRSWSSRRDRNELVSALIEELRQSAGALAERQAIESGQPLRECQDQASNVLRRLRRLDDHGPEPPGVRKLRLQRQFIWTFWENTLRAIAAGSAIVCELPADHALASLAIARCVHRLPGGVLNVITVDPDGTLPACRVSDFVFVAQDADLDVAVRGATALRLYNTGQRIGQSARIHVDAALAYRFADRLHEHLAFLECGDPTKPATDLGPLCSDAALRVAAEQVGLALRQGALVKLGGRPFQPWGLRGYFLQPTLLVEGVGRERVPYEWIAAPLIIVSPTVDVGTAVRESAGMARSPLRLTTFTGQLSKVEDSLRSAGFEVEAQPYTQLVDRARLASSESEQSAATVAIESIREPQADWFPYGSRRGLKL